MNQMFLRSYTKAMQNVVIKKNVLQMDFAAGVYPSEAQNAISPLYILYTCIQNTYSHREWREGVRVEPESRLEGQQFTKLGRK
jgi:hypothetical protein